MEKIKVRTPQEVFGSIKKNYNNPIFVEGVSFWGICTFPFRDYHIFNIE